VERALPPVRHGLRHLVEILRDSKDEYLTFRFAGELSETLVFRRGGWRRRRLR
jgi:hypothetical protein